MHYHAAHGAERNENGYQLGYSGTHILQCYFCTKLVQQVQAYDVSLPLRLDGTLTPRPARNSARCRVERVSICHQLVVESEQGLLAKYIIHVREKLWFNGFVGSFKFLQQRTSPQMSRCFRAPTTAGTLCDFLPRVFWRIR